MAVSAVLKAIPSEMSPRDIPRYEARGFKRTEKPKVLIAAEPTINPERHPVTTNHRWGSRMLVPAPREGMFPLFSPNIASVKSVSPVIIFGL